jgi:hypothetical protein
MGALGPSVFVDLLDCLGGLYGARVPRPAWIRNPDFARAFGRDKAGKPHIYFDSISQWVGRQAPERGYSEIQDRLVCAILNEAVRCLEDGLVSGPGMLDLAVVHGVGFPRYRGGPLRMADEVGGAYWAARARTLARASPWLAPPSLLETAGGFYAPPRP